MQQRFFITSANALHTFTELSPNVFEVNNVSQTSASVPKDPIPPFCLQYCFSHFLYCYEFILYCKQNNFLSLRSASGSASCALECLSWRWDTVFLLSGKILLCLLMVISFLAPLIYLVTFFEVSAIDFWLLIDSKFYGTMIKAYTSYSGKV